ncbi:hypothetical protein Godav_028463 [Gossypium davidsonii]|uniref:Uncharacterized protein n=1 Tax=Gossypium davidsonii TaxID=34287 RepID=A0A7J8S064_GOSDV|nr:hypothetical protein [Gossypium davidsonii]
MGFCYPTRQHFTSWKSINRFNPKRASKSQKSYQLSP